MGHVLSYLDDAAAVDQALAAAARALRPGGVLALHLCDLEYGDARHDAAVFGRVEDDWAIFTIFSIPSPDRFVRTITTSVRPDGSWRRDDERHVNVLVDTSRVPALLAEHGVAATVQPAFGGERLGEGLRAIVGRRDR